MKKKYIAGGICSVLLAGAGFYVASEETSCRSFAGGALAEIPGGYFLFGANPRNPEEGPPQHNVVDGFLMDSREVTNGDFARFVAQTGYVTQAERGREGHPGLDKNTQKPGGFVFTIPVVSENTGPPNWWKFVAGASWRHPEGPQSSIAGKQNHPVVQVTYDDARAYAAWAKARLPNEVEWEYAALGGEAERPDTPPQKANVWQGIFPFQNDETDGYDTTSPAGCYPPNPYGLYDMIGNVWEWTTSPYNNNQTEMPVKTIKGGSFLCADNYCARFRPAARQAQDRDLSTSHIGFRTVRPVSQATGV